MSRIEPPDSKHVEQDVAEALAEDLDEAGDLTAALIDPATRVSGRVITRESCILAGRPWAERSFAAVDKRIELTWAAEDGDRLAPNQVLFEVFGPARGILTGERTALNFLQLLSAVATVTGRYVEGLKDGKTRVLDTRKTLPGLRRAQKYAVRCGGGVNHRIGLFDAFLIKENHIAAAGSISGAVTRAQALASGQLIEVEVENLDELAEAIEAGAQRVMLDDFTLEDTHRAVALNEGRVELEASGGIEMDRLADIAATGVDYVSVGALTKHIRAIDLSMRLDSAAD
ncbi:MAG: carboxylating nicotinate-nucleotide diphosphorylase [Pseudomonadota bacterium]